MSIPDERKEERPYQFNIKALLLLAVVVALPLGIWEFRKTRSRRYANAASPFEDLGAEVHSSPENFAQFLLTYAFHSGDHLITSISFRNDPLTDQQLQSLHDELKSLPKLRWLDLQNSKVTDTGMAYVVDLGQLTLLDLTGLPWMLRLPCLRNCACWSSVSSARTSP